MSQQPTLSIVIPCYNEASRLMRTLVPTIAYLTARDGVSEIIVVSDGSVDATERVASEVFQTLPPNVHGEVIAYRPNQGKGHAVRVGMLAARMERVLFMDADYAVPIEELRVAEELLDAGCAIAIGSRAIAMARVVEHQGWLRERMSKLFGFIQRRYLGLTLLDTQCGFKLFTKDAARIFHAVQLTSVIFDGEVLWLAKRAGLAVREFPVEWTHDPDSRITYSVGRAMYVFWDMLKIPWIHTGGR